MLLAVMARDWATPFGSRKQQLNTLDKTCHQQIVFSNFLACKMNCEIRAAALCNPGGADGNVKV